MALIFSTAGCFSPSVDTDSASGGGEDGTVTETGGASSTDGPTGPTATGGDTQDASGSSGALPTSSDPSTETDSDTEAGTPPDVSLLVNGEARPGPVDSASAVEIRVAVEDDGQVESVSLLVDGEDAGIELESVGGEFVGEWVVSGEEVNGVRSIEAVAVDDEGLEGAAETNLTLDLPDGGRDPEDAYGFRMAVEEFQCDHGLLVDGVVGTNTLAMLAGVHGA